jgi:hypothetical protein
MKKEARKHLQKYCDVSNWNRMHRPKAGKANFEAGEALAEEILCLILKKNDPGYDGTAIMLTAEALVRSYNRKALAYSNAFVMSAHLHLMDKYEELFEKDAWMGMHHDGVQFQIEDFIRGNKRKFWDELDIYEEEVINNQ